METLRETLTRQMRLAPAANAVRDQWRAAVARLIDQIAGWLEEFTDSFPQRLLEVRLREGMLVTDPLFGVWDSKQLDLLTPVGGRVRIYPDSCCSRRVVMETGYAFFPQENRAFLCCVNQLEWEFPDGSPVTKDSFSNTLARLVRSFEKELAQVPFIAHPVPIPRD